MGRIGVLLTNIGTPDEPTPDAVGRYLREFLMDEYVLDMPFMKRWLLVNRVIVPRRKHYSAEHYQKIQMPEGSPLLVHTKKFAAGLASELSNGGAEFVVEIGMRYGNPSIAAGLANLKRAGVDTIVAVPLYPQYTQSSFETAVVETKRQAKKLGVTDRLLFVEPFYADAGFINANAHIVGEHLKTYSPDYTLFSFHGVPVRHIKQIDAADHCRVNDACCAQVGPTNANCYRAQCHATARAIATAVGLNIDQYTTCFQSQFGKDEWIGPAFEGLLRELPKRGIKTIAVACPSFVADCLETLEEVGIRGREEFREAGGEELTLIPCLNSDPLWIKAAANLIRKASKAAAETPIARATSGSV
ncbi:MAG TPA: ferrochelatase [Pyrinomonadaceae bacterium]